MILPGTKEIHTSRLILREFYKSDAESMFRNWISDKDIQNNYGEPEYKSIKAVEDYLTQICTKYKRNDYFRWAIIENLTRECIGQIAFCDINMLHKVADIEYCIGTTFQRKGYATEALKAVVSFTFTKTSINRLQAFHRGKNPVSGKVLIKSGFIFEGTLRDSFYYESIDQYDDKLYYGVIRSDCYNRDKGSVCQNNLSNSS